MEDDGTRKRTRRFFRVLLWLIASSLALLVLALGIALWFLHHLDHPAIRARIVQAVHDATGMEMDYEGLDWDWTQGLTLRGVRVLTPNPYRPYAPVLAGVDRLEVRWDIGSFLSGTPRFPRVAVSGVRVSLVQDESGRSSLLALIEAMPRPTEEKPSTPLSQGLPIRGLGLEVDSWKVEDVALSRLVLREGQVVRSETVEGIVLEGALHAGSTPESARWVLRSPDDAPTRLTIREIHGDGTRTDRSASIRHATHVVVSDPLNARLDAEVEEVGQDFRPDLSPSGPVLSLGLSLSLHPEESRMTVEVDRLTFWNGLVQGSVEADYFEGPDQDVRARIGKVQVTADLDRIPQAVRDLVPSVRWKGGTLTIAAEGIEAIRTAPGLRFRGKANALVSFPEVVVVSGDRRVEVRDLRASVEAAEGSFKVEALVGSRLVRVRDPHRLVTLRDASLSLRATVEDLPKVLAGEVGGMVVLDTAARVASLRTPTGRLRLQGFETRTTAPIRDAPPYEAQGLVRLENLAWIPARGERRSVPGGDLEWILAEAAPDPVAPVRSRGRFTVRGRIGDVSVDAEVVKEADQADIRASLAAQSLQMAEPFADAVRGLRIPLGRITLSVKTEGRVAGLAEAGGPRLDQQVTASVTGFQAVVSNRRVEVPSLVANLSVKGYPRDLQARGTIEAIGTRLDGRVPLRRVALTAETRVRASAPEARLALEIAGGRGPILDARLEARLEGTESALAWAATAQARDLSDVIPLLPPQWGSTLDLASFQAEIESSGRVVGLVGRGGHLRPRPLESARGKASLRARLRGLAYRSERLEVEVPNFDASLDVERTGPRGTAQVHVAYPLLRVDQRVWRIEVERGSHVVAVEADGDPRTGEVSVALRGTVARVSHDASTLYPIGDASLVARARISGLEAVRLDEFIVENPAGGTRFEANVALDDLGGQIPANKMSAWDLVIGRRSLAVTGTLEQRLDPLSRASFSASGLVQIPFRIQSGDRSLFRVSASLETRNVHVEVPAARVVVRGLNGTIPIEEEMAISRDGRVSLILETDHNLFSRVRFLDQHPFLRGGGFVAAERMVLGPLEVGPVAGNLRILRNLVSLDQIEATWRDGKVSGQVIVEYHPGDPRVSFRGQVTGVRPTGSDERLDANAAVDFRLGRREVAGRIHFVRIGRGHLLDLLDAFDPYREHVQANRIRKVLKYGYPKYARVRVNGGFLSAKVELGGIGSLVRIDEIRGIPTGPLLSRALGPMLPAQKRGDEPEQREAATSLTDSE